ncbi:hypothetical protein A1O7_04471 [Cladophialophora yegresii CBS 114405]|uniref:Uncharacterized protein n=1 Tax=Cladophialophora yegresii CBS 114405 TaxID=1182544 RepID=W9WPJ2_9EURO|nr:uncharacterized protein A1O7_04471 [Cladophialophora yegresii CBS 114405]EXJ60319.1 hypothetical protein A1O7_04471 [Cladophialophora yegresii CBS 114405]
MAAEHYGARLLEEVQEESLEKFLADLRNITCPQPRAVCGVPQLDILLEAVRYPAETTPQRPAWLSPERHDSDSEREGQQDADISLHGRYVEPALDPSKAQAKAKPATIELTSTTSASGKTTLLSYLAAVSVLPRRAGGKGSVVVYIDGDGRLSARRLKQIMYHYICQQRQQQHQESNQQSINPDNSNTSPLNPEAKVDVAADLDVNINVTIQEALHHVHVFRPQSSAQVLSILSNLETYLLDTLHSHRPLGVVIIDGTAAFYWQDRFDRAMARLETPGGQSTQAQGKGLSMTQTLRIIERLKRLQAKFECAVLFSTTTVPPAAPPSVPVSDARVTPAGPPADNGRSISPWTGYAALTLSLARTPVARFTPQMGIEECVAVRERRFEAMRQGRFTAVVQSMKSVEGVRPAGVTVAGFRFNITEQGVEVGWMDG